MKTYQELKSAVEDYTLRTDMPFAALLRLAENEILRRLRVNGMKERWESTIGEDDLTKITLPPRFLELVSLKDKDGKNVPCNRVGTELILPTPIKNTTITAEYYFRPPDLNENDNSNSLLSEYPNIYFSAIMSQFYMWAGDNEQAQRYAEVAVQEIGVINAENMAQTSIAQNLDVDMGSIV